MPRSTGSVVFTLSVALLLTSAAVPASAKTDPFAGYVDQELSWGPCSFEQDPDVRPAECALVTVPRDWAAPDAGRDLRVAISRVAATGEHLGSLLVNPGGPGGQGTSLAGMLAAVQPAVNERYAIVGMDPRGTGQEGATAPELAQAMCEVPVDRFTDPTELDARDRSPDNIAEHRTAPRAIAQACQSEAITPYITTWQTAHDMELIRQLLNEPRLDYLGYSYGTWLGAKYAALFPDSAGKMVLDSSMDFQGRLQATFEAWPPITQRVFEDMFLPWMTRQYPEYVGTTVEEAAANWERARQYLAEQGYPPNKFDWDFLKFGSLMGWLYASIAFVAGVQGANGESSETIRANTSPWLDAQVREHFGVPLAELTPAEVARILVEDDEDYAHYPLTRYAVACGDQPTRSPRWYKQLSDQQGPRYPLFGWQYGLTEPCAFWSDEPRQELPTLPASVSGRVLVVQAELDPQTGYEQARSAVRAAPGVTMISVDDSPFHAQYALEGNPCVDGMVNAFLLHNSRPGNVTCPGLPLPDETEVHPVPGPVGTQPAPAAAAAAVAPLPALRASVQAMISDVNAVVPGP